MVDKPYPAAPVLKDGPGTPLRYLHAFGAMGRPLFLLGTLPLYLLGVAAAWHEAHTIQVPLLTTGLLLSWLVQLMTHYNNEYHDLDTDLATEIPTRISGGSRVLVRGLVPRTAARIAGVLSLLLALALALAMVLALGAGVLTMAFVGAGALLGWFYSAPPIKLESRGVGEITIVAASCWLLPGISYYLQMSTIAPALLVACLPLSLLTFAVTLATELPDIAADRATGKLTLVARLGRERAVWLHNAVLVAGWIALGTWAAYAWPLWGWVATVASVPLVARALVSARDSARGHTASMERMGLTDSMLLGYATAILVAAFILG